MQFFLFCFKQNSGVYAPVDNFMLGYLWYFLILVNPFHATGLFLYPLKTENLYFFHIFRGYKKRLVNRIEFH